MPTAESSCASMLRFSSQGACGLRLGGAGLGARGPHQSADVATWAWAWTVGPRALAPRPTRGQEGGTTVGWCLRGRLRCSRCMLSATRSHAHPVAGPITCWPQPPYRPHAHTRPPCPPMPPLL